MRCAIATLTLLLLAGCEKAEIREAREAEERLALLKSNHPSNDERCAAEREVERAWLAALDQQKYREARQRADITCRSAEIDRLLGR